MTNLRVAILGATGLVGQEFIKVLKQRNFPMASLLLLASGASAGKRVIVDGDEIEVQEAAFRMEPEIPLVVPEVNPEDLEKHQGIIANPNCSTIQMVVALYPLHRVNPIKRIIVDTYQAVSGTGKAAIEELSEQAKLMPEGEDEVLHVYPHQIAFNVLPHIDVFLENSYSREEWKLEQGGERYSGPIARGQGLQ